MSKRHVEILNVLLDRGRIHLMDLVALTRHHYMLKNPQKAIVRDLNYLLALDAIAVQQLPNDRGWEVWANLDWPTKITETEFFRRVKEMPKGKSYGFLSK